MISWKAGSPTNPQPTERLFVSGKAALDGSKPVRGGIPVVFPAFGAPTHPDHAKLSQHGFARNNVWAFGANVMDNEAGVSVKLSKSSAATKRTVLTPRYSALAPNDAIKAQFDHPFELEYVVTLAEHQLTTGLHVKHTGLSTTAPFEFQALFHNYIRAPANDVRISPLSGISYYDKTEATEEARAAPKLEARAGVDVNKFTDSVYEDAGGRYDVVWPRRSHSVVDMVDPNAQGWWLRTKRHSQHMAYVLSWRGVGWIQEERS